jgi:predicted RNA-binding protein with PIN domain
MVAARPRYLLVDGHSVIHAWDELRAMHEQQPRRARLELERRLSRLQDRGDERVVLVFDGQGSSTQSSRGRSVDVQVVYSGRGATADAVIERLVAGYAPTYDLTVVTADEAERLAVSALGAWWISPATLREKTEGSHRDQQKVVARLRGRGGGYRLGDRLEDGIARKKQSNQ